MSDHALAEPRTDGARLIGPNALIQTAAALHELEPGSAAAVLVAAGEPTVRDHPPEDMVDERRFTQLVATLVETLGETRAQAVLVRSGMLTAEYLLTHRIPPPFQWLVRRLPRDLGLRLLLGAVASHAWTFAGSGRFRYDLRGDGVVELTLEDCPACRGLHTAQPVCGFYAGTFQHLFRKLVDDRIRVVESGCSACGGHCCALHGAPLEEVA